MVRVIVAGSRMVTNKYIIHACPARMWYVTEYLVPSMKEQGITDITIKCDYWGYGNLKYCMTVFSQMTGEGGAWHLQDDVIICRDFAERTNSLVSKYGENTVICGYAWNEDDNREKWGYVDPSDMWWSFPCIYIPNNIARDCARWFFTQSQKMSEYEEYVRANKFDDMFMKDYLVKYVGDRVINLKPNLVDHIDFLVGGTTINAIRQKKQTRAQYFEDTDLVTELENKLKERQ